ncbi:hypothetical protein ACRWQN_17480 [Shewanella sp. HL-SH8]|uniref:hypothetical protein n=1 Tax=Shewanella sp. HL-SH8 TaxID=3436242 RepID=UPI003EBEFE74
MTQHIADNTKNIMLDSLSVLSIGLHRAAPGGDGLSNEITSSSYSRQSCSFGIASSGKRVLIDDVKFSLTTGDVVNFVSYWSGNTFVMSESVDPIFYSANGLLTINALTTVLTI